jgi:hypothetical protein
VSPSSKFPSAPLRLTQKAGGARESRKCIQFGSDKVFPAKDGIGSKLLSVVYAGAFATKVIKAIAGRAEGDQQGTALLNERHWSDECLVRSQTDGLPIDQTFRIAE